MMRFIEAYYSVIGSKHLELGSCNQDACFFKKDENTIVMTVADGVGSLENSHFGSREVGDSVFRAFKMWVDKDTNNLLDLSSLIFYIWNKKFDKPEMYSTTCLFTVIYNNTLYIGQVGDGIIFYIYNDELKILYEKDDDFSNITTTLYSAGVADFYIKRIKINYEDKIAVFMATDGISSSLLKSKYADFLEYIMYKINDNINSRNDVIKDILNDDWKSSDDKTIAVIYNY
ncbi:protein phosphatase 2C domain-containing protein [uncultured Brachyspira sp.]|uniref:protein phosphatase 2C domain-containing protein n=1 Tax=uncultured Brachyspira sp. TaxID=221953 RepID=UPI002625E992|nr:protein phosphatase 2C domain-containing protein [uncultured Brachyspira sp.]